MNNSKVVSSFANKLFEVAEDIDINGSTMCERIASICASDTATLYSKGKTYGDSWKKRGGTGAFMMLARKWDRIENQCAKEKYDVFTAVDKSSKCDGLLDDIRDLRAYLLLVEDHIVNKAKHPYATLEDA